MSRQTAAATPLARRRTAARARDVVADMQTGGRELRFQRERETLPHIEDGGTVCGIGESSEGSMTRLMSIALFGCVLVVASPVSICAQTPKAPQAKAAISEGTVVSITKNTLVIRTSDGQFVVFELNAATMRPTDIPMGSTVSVASFSSDDEVAPVAAGVKVTALPPDPSSARVQGLAPPVDEPIPPSVRQLERSIQRQVQRYHIGVRAGASLDPELISFGVHGQLGPFFRENIWARPNIEFGFGELTTLVALNFEGLYRLPVRSLQSNWAVFVGAGPALNFENRGFSEEEDGNRFDFNDFDLDVGLNLFLGMQMRSGVFLELKGTAYAGPHIRFLLGYNF